MNSIGRVNIVDRVDRQGVSQVRGVSHQPWSEPSQSAKININRVNTIGVNSIGRVNIVDRVDR